MKCCELVSKKKPEDVQKAFDLMCEMDRRDMMAGADVLSVYVCRADYLLFRRKCLQEADPLSPRLTHEEALGEASAEKNVPADRLPVSHEEALGEASTEHASPFDV